MKIELPKNKALENVVKNSKPGQFGNLFSYYDRKKYDHWNDPRLSSLPANTFKGKEVLYIGCHEGIVPIQIALKYQAKHVTAIDIDGKLLTKAVNNAILIDTVRKMSSSEMREYNLDFHSWKGSPLYEGYQSVLRNEDLKTPLLNKLDFQIQNILDLDADFEKHKFDVICCFKVTKFIHLNFGDLGIRTLFKNMANLLKSEGQLLLHAQGWKSYRKMKSFCPVFTCNFSQIKLLPSNFSAILRKDFRLSLQNSQEKKNGTNQKNTLKEQDSSKVSIFMFE